MRHTELTTNAPLINCNRLFDYTSLSWYLLLLLRAVYSRELLLYKYRFDTCSAAKQTFDMNAFIYMHICKYI